MRFFTLLFVAALSATILTGCERQLISPVDPIDPPETDTQFAQMALLSLANTATKVALVDLANAASEIAEALAIDDGTSVQMWRVTARYNEAWCQGNFDAIDGILIGESGLDFFDYVFVGNLATIYAEEIPETAAHIQTNTPRYPLWVIAVNFLDVYFQNSKKTLDEVVELFRQYVRTGQVRIPYYY